MLVPQQTTSKQFTLNTRDILRGLLVAVLSPVFTILLTSLDKGELTFNWKVIGAVALSAALSYVLKNFLSPGTVVIEDEKVAEAVKEGTSKVTVIDKK